MKVDVRELSWAVEGAQILSSVSLACAPGTMIGLVGPNGSGKSSLLRCMYRVVRPNTGVVAIDGRDVWALGPRDVARDVGVVPQDRASDTSFTVHEIVLMGRSPHKNLLERDTPQDLEIVASALARVGAGSLATRVFDTLSGGEQQRVVIARAIAQTPRVLLLDEPTTHLDIGHQHETLRLIRSLGLTTIAALHDLNLATAYCDHLVMLKGGTIRAQGPPSDVLTPSLIEELYGVKVAIGQHPLTGRLHVFV